jgi:prefoldin subunit 5
MYKISRTLFFVIVLLSYTTLAGCVDRGELTNAVENADSELFLLESEIDELRTRLDDLGAAVGDLTNASVDFDNYDSCNDFAQEVIELSGSIEFHYSELEDVLDNIDIQKAELEYSIRSINNL